MGTSAGGVPGPLERNTALSISLFTTDIGLQGILATRREALVQISNFNLKPKPRPTSAACRNFMIRLRANSTKVIWIPNTDRTALNECPTAGIPQQGGGPRPRQQPEQAPHLQCQGGCLKGAGRVGEGSERSSPRRGRGRRAESR